MVNLPLNSCMARYLMSGFSIMANLLVFLLTRVAYISFICVVAAAMPNIKASMVKAFILVKRTEFI